jgi:hypothetical protein
VNGNGTRLPAKSETTTSKVGNADRIRSGNEFTSVAHGLALRAAEVLRQA